jgi:hypothetical protein
MTGQFTIQRIVDRSWCSSRASFLCLCVVMVLLSLGSLCEGGYFHQTGARAAPPPQAASTKPSAYKVLGVADTATDVDIKDAYRKLALKVSNV